MSTKGKPPFLGGEDLLSELDAWDATFDALHGEVPVEQAPVHVEPSQVGDATSVSTIPAEPRDMFPVEPTDLVPGFDGGNLTIDQGLDEQLTLDGALEAIDGDGDATIDRELRADELGATDELELESPDDTRQMSADAVQRLADAAESVGAADETDFSGVGVEGPSSALGDLLGRTPDPDELAARAPRAGSTTRPPTDDEVFTSASRPAPVDELSFEDDDDLAPPPIARPSTSPGRAPTVAGGALRTPAIVRRPPKVTPQPIMDDDPFGDGENTRVSSLHEIEARRIESKIATTLPPVNVPVVDDEYDIEVDAPTPAPARAPSPDPRGDSKPDITLPARRTAHVLRRGDARSEQTTKPPPVGGPLSTGSISVIPASAGARHQDEEDDHVIEMSIEDDGGEISDDSLPPIPPSTPRATTPTSEPAEDDFSDIAASFGAEVAVPDAPETPIPQVQDELGLDAALDEMAGFGDDGDEPSIETSPPDPVPHDEPPEQLSDRAVPQATAPTIPLPIDYARQRVKTPTGMIGTTREAIEKFPPIKTLVGVTATPPAGTPTAVTSSSPAQIARPAIADLSRAIDLDPALDLDAIGRDWPEQLPPLAAGALDEASAEALLIYEREIATVDDSAVTAALRNEAGRLSERLGDLDRARSHYDEALLADPRSTSALRGLRRIARASGDLAEATRHLEAEMAVAGGLERRPLGHYRIDLLMASGEQDLARVAVGEILDSAPSDVRALLAQLELAFLDGRADEFGSALEQLAHAVTDNELRAAVQSARGVLAAHSGHDTNGAATWFAAAAESDPASLAARLGAIRQAAAQADGAGAARALLELALGTRDTDPTTAAAAAVRAQQWGAPLAQLAIDGAPDDPLVARLAAEAALAAYQAEVKRAEAPPPEGEDPADVEGARSAAAAAFARWARATTVPAERAYAAARSAELDPASGVALWTIVLEADPGDDYSAAQLRTAHVAAESTDSAIAVDLGVARGDPTRDRARLRAAYGLIATGKLDEAIGLLDNEPSAHLIEALGEALAAANRWGERAKLFGELAANPGEQLDRDVAMLRSALAWEEAIASQEDTPDPEMIARAIEAWTKVLEVSPAAPTAHAALTLLAQRSGDGQTTLSETLARTQAGERSPWAASTIGLARARLAPDADEAERILRDIPSDLDDPRRTLALMLLAAKGAATDRFTDAAVILEERATLLEARTPVELDEQGQDRPRSLEPAALRLRAAQLALDGGDATRANTLLSRVEQAMPNLAIVQDLLSAARRRSGDRSQSDRGTAARRTDPGSGASGDAFARLMRDADLAAQHGDSAAAVALYQRALELRQGDPLAAIPLVRVATELRQPAPIAAIALDQLKQAEAASDGVAKASAYELLARIDADLRDDVASAQIALESASTADPSRIDLMHRLERLYTEQDQLTELVRLRAAELASIPADLHRDRAALLVDLAGLASRDRRADTEIADHYRAALAEDPKARLALLHLEAMVRRAGASAELAELEDRISQYFASDPKSAAAFATRSGETLAEIGQIDTAVQRFGQAEGILPGHVPALEGWRQAALKGQLWIDVADAATRLASSPAIAASDDANKQRGALLHFAGVALMDKALVGDQAMGAFKKAIEADPTHRDAFLRLRILLEEDGNHDELAVLLEKRLEVEADPHSRSELHRALAELCRNFLSDREGAKKHYRAILEVDPNDLRAHATLADIAWEQGAWQDAAEALVARARLERAPEILKTLCFRLGTIYADFLVDPAMAIKAFQRALSYAPEDENTLVRLAELATSSGEWKLALGACERLVKQETDPDRRATHLHRVAKIFKLGFGDAKRAERALNLALDGAPTNDEALSKLVEFYQESNDIQSVRVHLNRVAGTMRARAANDPKDGIALRVISRVMTARAAAGVGGSTAIARAAAELADALGAGGEPEKLLLREPPPRSEGMVLTPESDEVLFPRGIQSELRQLFQLLGDRVAKHVGVNLQPYGVARGDRLRAKDSAVAQVAQAVATQLGFGDIDVYISQKQPWVMVAEPTSPVSLVIGQAIAEAGDAAVRFAAGGALKLAQSSLAIPARLPADELGVLVVALLRLFQPDFPGGDLDAEPIAAQLQKLKRLIPNSLVVELRPYALAIDPQRFRHEQLSRDLKITALRAGLVTSGSLLTGLQILAGQAGVGLKDFLADPVAQGLVSFAISEDHAVVAR